MFTSRRALQIAVCLACLVPILAGLAGALSGGFFLSDHAAPVPQDSHLRYLSGLLLAIGVAFVSAVPDIERHSGRFRLLTAIVLTGGAARLVGAILTGAAPIPVLFPLAMELVVTPALAIWQNAVAKAAGAKP